jgi:hypothetical protein
MNIAYILFELVYLVYCNNKNLATLPLTRSRAISALSKIIITRVMCLCTYICINVLIAFYGDFAKYPVKKY